jgi:hypothetical protein
VEVIFAYFSPTLVAIGVIVWLVTNGNGFGQVPPASKVKPIVRRRSGHGRGHHWMT